MIPQYLKQDIISFNKKTVYGRQGERVFIIKNLHPVVIVSNEYGERFSCHVNELSHTKIQTNDLRVLPTKDSNKKLKRK